MNRIFMYVIIFVIIFGTILWFKWPKELPLPEYQKNNLVFESEYIRLTSSNDVVIIEYSKGEQYRYSESPESTNRLFGISQKIKVKGSEYIARSAYQVFQNTADAASLMKSNELLGMIPGTIVKNYPKSKNYERLTVYESDVGVNIFALNKNILYSISLEPGLEIDTNALQQIISGKLESITSK